jgi:hypothetical protein
MEIGDYEMHPTDPRQVGGGTTGGNRRPWVPPRIIEEVVPHTEQKPGHHQEDPLRNDQAPS